MAETSVDRDVTALLAELGPPVPVAELSTVELRQSMRDAVSVFTHGAAPIAVDRVTDEHVPGGAGSIPARIYTPARPAAVMVYLHGGGWVVGDLDTHDLVARRICRDTQSVVVSVDYRLMPEHPFPAALQDAWDATTWAARLRPDLPFLVAGDSAGATLAACVALTARDDGGPRIDGQVLVYPVVDDDLDAPSMQTYRDGPRITRDDLAYYLRMYLGTVQARRSPYVLPGHAKWLGELPPTVLAVAGHDPLRSSEQKFGRRLEAAGIEVTVQVDPELVHGWIDFAPRVPSADRAFSRLTQTINDLIHRGHAAA
ncbi:alpha/beta hydrolase [Aeromicrobium terrae]|uniref:alpha/beta hydrolase n=1 Tax=Aeromicrobium terrae TaxID=2498846 RepID=UPI00164EDA94|nr:alpha/beta hydrolase [Aeromicrobium terrae]